MNAHTKFYLAGIGLTSIGLYIFRLSPTHKVVWKIGRIVLQILIIGTGLLLTSMASQWSGVYGLLTENPIRDLTVMTLLSYCYVYRHERHWFAGLNRFLSMGALLALMLWADVFLWQETTGTIVSAMLIPVVLPLMRWIEKRFIREASLKLSDMHYTSHEFEISYETATNELLVRFVLQKGTATEKIEEAFKGNVPAIQHVSSLPCGERWLPNIDCSWSDEIVTRHTNNSSTIWIPGTTSTGYSSSGEFVTVNNPGTTITVPGTKTFSFEEKTGKYIAYLCLMIKNKKHQIVLSGLSQKDKFALESVIDAIYTALKDLCRQHNAQEVATIEDNP